LGGKRSGGGRKGRESGLGAKKELGVVSAAFRIGSPSESYMTVLADNPRLIPMGQVRHGFLGHSFWARPLLHPSRGVDANLFFEYPQIGRNLGLLEEMLLAMVPLVHYMVTIQPHVLT
jgi:hypothetical protein